MKVSASLVKAAPVLVSAILLALTYWPANLILLSFVALAPWLWSLRMPDANWKRSGILMGTLFFGYHMLWLFPFIGRWTGSYPIAAIPWAISVGLQIPYFILLAFLIRRCYERGWNWAVPFVWITIEFIRSSIPYLAFPHALLATPLAAAPNLIQGAAVGTIFFVSGWIVLINVCVVELFERANPRSTMVLAAAAAAIGMFSVMRHSSPPLGVKKVVSIGQLGLDLAFGDPATEPARIAEAVPLLSEQAYMQGADLLLLPEGLGPAGNDTANPNWPFQPPDTPVVFGMQRGSEAIYQSAFAFDGKWQHVDKTHLVIFGEYVPFRSQLSALGGFRLPTLDLVPGDKIGTMTVNGIHLGPLLCFEAMFYDVAAEQADTGARLLTVHSIDDWYMNSGMPEQLWASCVFRAVENGLPLARSASLGYTGWIDARGNVRRRLPLNESRTVRAEITLPEKSDAFTYRTYFPWVAVLISIAVLAVPRRKPTE